MVRGHAAQSGALLLGEDERVLVPRVVALGRRRLRRRGAICVRQVSPFLATSTHFGGAYAFLDWTALGRQEDWEEPKGRAAIVRGPNPDFAV